jgi:cytochrome c oxidase cbb3-type subunit II
VDKQLERFPGIFTVGGLILFFVGLTISALLPLIGIMGNDQDQVSIETLAANPKGSGFEELAQTYSEEFAKYWEEGATPANYEDALKLGREVYIENACYQCHTQQVREFAFEIDRYGSVSTLAEQNNNLMKPTLFGIRRIGPDLSRTGVVNSNGDRKHNAEWYMEYFWDPTVKHGVNTIMPRYPWLYEEEGKFNKDGFALITYLQWLGSQQPTASDDSEE